MYSTQETKFMDAYNKHDRTGGHGTLMANWWEENELNKANGQSFVLVTHAIEVGNSAHRIVRMRDGEIVDDGHGHAQAADS